MYTGKTKIISRYRSYHGSTMASIAATGDPRRWAIEPGGKGAVFIFAPETNCYDCPIKHTYPQCGIACADYIEHMIRNESKPLIVDQIAARMMAQGISIQEWVSHFMVAPPLIASNEELDLGLAALDEQLSVADALVES